MKFQSLASRMALFMVFSVSAIFYLALASPFDRGGRAQAVEESIPQEHVYLKNLARQLVIHNEKMHEELKSAVGSIRSLGWFMSRYPGKFSAPVDWFEQVAQTKEIPAPKIEALLTLAEKGPLSTNEAADWLLEVSVALKHMESAQGQQAGVRALRDAYAKSLAGERNKE